MKKYICTLLVGSAFILLPSISHANTLELYTLSGFLELLSTKGLIASEKMALAEEVLEMLKQKEMFTETPSELFVEASQRIEHADLTFNTFEDVQGLVLLVKNQSNQNMQLLANTSCPVTYTIFEGNSQRFESSTLSRCKSTEQAKYELPAGDSRMFEVTHKQDDFRLGSGTYRFVLTYPGYGSGEREVTIR